MYIPLGVLVLIILGALAWKKEKDSEKAADWMMEHDPEIKEMEALERSLGPSSGEPVNHEIFRDVFKKKR